MADTEDTGSEKLTILDCHSQNLEYLVLDTGIANASLTEINIAFNDISFFPDNLGKICPNLTKLDLTGNQFTVLPPSIDELEKLEVLIADENEITSLNVSFEHSKYLKELHLLGNKLTALDKSIGFLCSLEKLVLDENSLSEFPDSLCDLIRLRVLEVAENSVQSLPDNIGHLINLEVLNVSRNELEVLPVSLQDLEKLRFLDVSHNKVKNLPTTFKSSHCLERFYAGDNRVISLPDWINDLKFAEAVCLKNNHISGIPLSGEFAPNLKKRLKTLHLGGNFIESLPDNLGELENLEFIHLGSVLPEIERANFQNGNWIRELPSSFGNLRSLTKARLDENQLVSLPERFGDLVNLEYLDLGQNYLSLLPESFCELRLLRFCFLSKNRLQKLPENFGNLSQLIELKLDSNQLQEIPESIKLCTSIKILDLFDNLLKEIPEILPYLTKLSALDLDENDLGIDVMDIPCFNNKIYYAASRRNYTGNHGLQGSEEGSLSVLNQALKNKKQLWAAHGETGVRSKGIENRRTKRVSLHEEAEQTGSEEGTDDESAVSENWDGDGPIDQENPLEMGVSMVTIETEDWDKEMEELNLYDMPMVEYQHPLDSLKPRGKPVVDFFFVPADDHPPETPFPLIEEDYEEGQFDDAD